MSNSEDYPSRLDEEEIFAIFNVINERGEPEEAQELIHKSLHLPRRHRKTITAVFNVGKEFFRRDPNAPNVLTTQEADKIAEKAAYGVSRPRVVELHRLYQLWKTRRREETKTEELGAGEPERRAESQRDQGRLEIGIEFDHETDLRYYQYEGLPVVRKFACVRVVAKRGIARCCEGTLKVVAAEDARRELFPESKLQWFNEPYNEAVKPVDIITSEQLCVVFTEIPAGQIVKRPDRGVVIYPPVAQAIAPDKIPACPSSRQWVKLDILPIRVIGRRESMDWHRVTPREGAWIGTPMALNSPRIAHQDYLPPGQYDIKVRVRCDGGGDEERFFRVQSPRAWDSEKPLGWRDLQMMEL